MKDGTAGRGPCARPQRSSRSCRSCRRGAFPRHGPARFPRRSRSPRSEAFPLPSRMGSRCRRSTSSRVRGSISGRGASLTVEIAHFSEQTSLTARPTSLPTIARDAGGREAVQYGDSTWRSVDVPCAVNPPRSKTGPTGAWFRTTFEIPASWAGQAITLESGAVNYIADVWLDGRWCPGGPARPGATARCDADGGRGRPRAGARGRGDGGRHPRVPRRRSHRVGAGVDIEVWHQREPPPVRRRRRPRGAATERVAVEPMEVTLSGSPVRPVASVAVRRGPDPRTNSPSVRPPGPGPSGPLQSDTSFVRCRGRSRTGPQGGPSGCGFISIGSPMDGLEQARVVIRPAGPAPTRRPTPGRARPGPARPWGTWLCLEHLVSPSRLDRVAHCRGPGTVLQR